MISKTRDKAKNMNEDRDKGSFILLYYFRPFFFLKTKTLGFIYKRFVLNQKKRRARLLLMQWNKKVHMAHSKDMIDRVAS